MIDAYAANTLRYQPDLCNGCMMCAIVCPHAVFARDTKRVRLDRPSSCMECGACQLNCPTGALQVESGVGCAYALMRAALLGRKQASCGDSGAPSCGCEES